MTVEVPIKIAEPTVTRSFRDPTRYVMHGGFIFVPLSIQYIDAVVQPQKSIQSLGSKLELLNKYYNNYGQARFDGEEIIVLSDGNTMRLSWK